MSPQEYRAVMRSLNTKQLEVVMFHRKWCKDAIFALKHDRPMPQFKVFLSGPGGVGKSHVIKLVHYTTMKLLKPLSGHFDPDELPVLLTAFTGTAVFGIEGMTLHSSLGFSSGPKNQKQYQPAGSEKLNTLRSRLSKLKLLIIDEVSMVGADLLYHVHRRLQDICGTSDQDSRFGGVSVLAVGDLYQLPVYSYARLHGSLWEENFKLMELTESMRQKDDQHFAQLLMRVRTATCTQDDINLLKTRVVTKTDSSYPANALHVFKTNKEVDQHNAEHLKKLPNTVFDIKAVDQKKDVQTGLKDVIISTKPSHTGGLREVVSVAVGARVMVTVNIDVSDGLANGVCGAVVGIESSGSSVHTIFIKFDSRRVGMQAIANSQYKQSYPEAVPIKRQDVHLFAGRGRRSLEAKRSQFPLSLAWGCTIHKVQGKTMDQIVVSMEGKGSFMPGQAYVALSRVKKLNGLFLLGFDATSICVNPAVVREMERLRQEAATAATSSSPTPAHGQRRH
ncbi:ATP-dependent DNA helicase PIF1-like [Pholidichthys leucotaenia]